MGSFAELYTMGNTEIQDKEEFIKRVEKVFQYGGMMDVEEVRLYGKKLLLLRKTTMDSEGMKFCYNYFEDDRWENAGFSMQRCKVWSRLIGWKEFRKTVVAAYVLQEQYTKGTSITVVNNNFVTAWRFVGWLNYLFDEQKHVRNFDTWKLFEEYYYSGNKFPEWNDWEQWDCFGDKRYAFVSKCEIYAVIYGVDKTLEKFRASEKGEYEKLILYGMQGIKVALEKISEHEEVKGDTSSKILDILKMYYKNENYKNKIERYGEAYKELFLAFEISDAPAFLVKGVAEVCGKDFWELWEEIKDITCRKKEKLYGNEGYYIIPISTEKFFELNPDDMIPYWEQDGNLEFSDELWDWFKDLKEEYDQLVVDDVWIEYPLRYILDLMEEADDNFCNIYTFKEFFEESLENMGNKKYQALWRLYEKMIFDPELRKAADIIFVPEEPGHEREGIHYLGKQPKRRLRYSWDIIGEDKKHNKGRTTLRRYMALVGNKKLRKKVFGV